MNQSADGLVSDLSSNDVGVRERARKALEALGERSVEPLRTVLHAPRQQTRWEAAKALGTIGGAGAAEALVMVLEDESRDVRYVAAEGLASIGDECLEPLLRELISHSDSIWMREGAIQVVSILLAEGGREFLRPVVKALTNGAPIFEGPIAAFEALHKLQQRRYRSSDTNPG